MNGKVIVASIVGILLLTAAWQLRGEQKPKSRFRRWQPVV